MAVPLLAPGSSACPQQGPSEPREHRGSFPPKISAHLKSCRINPVLGRTQHPGLAQGPGKLGQNPAELGWHRGVCRTQSPARTPFAGGSCCRNSFFLQHMHCCRISHFFIVALLLFLLLRCSLELPLEPSFLQELQERTPSVCILTGWLLSLSTVASISQICCPSRRISQH